MSILSEKKKLKRLKRRKKLVKMSNGRCHDCGKIFPDVVFDFHHVEAKEFTLNSCSMDRSWKSIVKEWEKCIMLCANCHRICHNIGEYLEP